MLIGVNSESVTFGIVTTLTFYEHSSHLPPPASRRYGQARHQTVRLSAPLDHCPFWASVGGSSGPRASVLLQWRDLGAYATNALYIGARTYTVDGSTMFAIDRH